ncbi:MAG: glycosyl hydrolase family 8 [Prevotella sp.]|nr:glycosyl hydrolase family 8 [Prevotella sp.]
MKNKFYSLVIACCCIMFCIPMNAQRNYFKELGYSIDEINAKIEAAYYEVFEGPNRAYQNVGDKMGYVADVKNKDVRTEGQSYGMMVAVQLNKQDIFNRIWRWSKEYMMHKEGPMKGFFAWHCKRDGTKLAQGSACDGELYFITDLLLASRRWGNDGEINYLKEAQILLNTIFSKDGSDGVYSIINMEHKIICFTPDKNGYKFSDPSYNLPAFYEIWAESAQDGREGLYRQLADNARAYLHKCCDEKTGINPDNTDFEGKATRFPGFGGRPAMVSEFHFDSWRVPMNIAMDFVWYGKDRQWQKAYADKFQTTLCAQGITTFPDQYAHDGGKPNFIMPAGGKQVLRHSIGLVATAATASLMTDNQYSKDLVRHLWDMKLKKYSDGYYDVYYDGLLYIFSLLHLSGNYRMWFHQPQLSDYFAPATEAIATPDENGFIRRWTLLEPISKPNRSNTVFTDTYLRGVFGKEYFAKQMTIIPKNGQVVKATVEIEEKQEGPIDFRRQMAPPKIKNEVQKLAWHQYDSKLYNVKLFRFASCLDKQMYGVLFWGVTVIDCENDIPNVRLAVGSNGASMWWLNGEEVLMLSGDRRMVADDGMSGRITLKKGRNILRCAVINGPGMSDFCARFIDEKGQPVKNFTIVR